ncbi:MIC26 protein, partial [Oceanites oceanicus]|nr:MIC26 protein [Oceanites oceanicus]
LSLYSSPARETKYVENPQTQLEERVSHLRHVMEPYTAWCQSELVDSSKVKVDSSLCSDFFSEGYEFLQNPPAGFYPRLGVIGFAGIVGLFLARGNKIIFPRLLSSCFLISFVPKVAGTQLYDWSLQGYIAVESLWKDN